MSGEQEQGRARMAHHAHAATLLARPDVTGVAVGLRRRGGHLTQERVLKVYVAHKKPPHLVHPAAMLPASIATAAGEAAVDVEEMPPPRVPPMHTPQEEAALAAARLRVPRRPAIGGASLAHYRFPTGTVALGVRDNHTGAACLLSCNHVLAQVDRALPGDPVLQPAHRDGGGPLSIVGHLLRWTDLRFDGTPNHADAAIAICPPWMAMSEVDMIGPITGIAPSVALGGTMRKVGRATGLTEGRVVGLHGSFKANYALLGFGNTQAVFVDQIVVELGCGFGDSGSLLVDDENRAAGLLFAATDRLHTWFNPFTAVADALDISLLQGI
jgi:hypothetical protein